MEHICYQTDRHMAGFIIVEALKAGAKGEKLSGPRTGIEKKVGKQPGVSLGINLFFSFMFI